LRWCEILIEGEADYAPLEKWPLHKKFPIFLLFSFYTGGSNNSMGANFPRYKSYSSETVFNGLQFTQLLPPSGFTLE